MIYKIANEKVAISKKRLEACIFLLSLSLLAKLNKIRIVFPSHDIRLEPSATAQLRAAQLTHSRLPFSLSNTNL